MSSRQLSTVGWNAVGLAVFVVMIFPVYWMVSTAFKTGPNIFSYSPKWVPIPATLANFGDAIHRQYFWQNVRNSLIVVIVVVTFSLVLAFLAALALAKFRFYGRKAFIVITIAVLMVPLNALIIPLYITLSRVHEVNKLSGVIITYMTFVLPFAIWTLRGFLLGVPRELEEAAMVDGATRFGALFASFCRSLPPAWWRRRSSLSFRPGTSTSSPTCCSAVPRSRLSPCGLRPSPRTAGRSGAP